MLIQVLSDLHLDVNRDYPFEFRPHKEVSPDVVVVAGDTCGSPLTASDFLKRSFGGDGGPQVIFVCGNHVVYNDDGVPIEEIKRSFHDEFPINGRISFLDESVGAVSKEIGGVLFVGSCTYTDYRYKTFGGGVRNAVSTNMWNAVRCRMSQEAYMNDFEFGITEEPPFFGEKERCRRSDGRYRLMPQHYRKYFHRTMRAFERVVSENADKPVVLVTHHCLSPMCIAETMDKRTLTASYVSQSERFINDHENIRAVVSGHVHNSICFDICRKDKSVCKYVMNPRGYTGRHESDGWTPYVYIDTKDWSVVAKPYSNEAWKRTLKGEDERFLRNFGMLNCFL